MEFIEGFIPGSLGRIVELHARYYALEWSFGTFFETKVASELSEFAARYDPQKDLVLLVVKDDQIHASLIIDMNDPKRQDDSAHLRWFIVSDELRGEGIGRRLMTQAMAHVDQHAKGKCWLTTFAGLTPARALYEKHGFRLVREDDSHAYGVKVRAQVFERQPI